MITHHPIEATLVAYAAGTLPEALAIVAATHLGHCAACRRALATLETAGGVLLDDVPPVPLSGDALERLLARAEELPPGEPLVLHPDLPPPLDRVPMGRWWPIGLGLRWRPLRTSGAAWAGLILGQPGRALPRHGHDGQELTCVLSGAFADARGEYAAGDLSEPDDDHDQPPVVVGTAPCLCVIASEGMRLRGILGLAQRAIGL
jgi:putative transcriptional regulator